MDLTAFVTHLGGVIQFDLLSGPAQPTNDSEDSIFGASEKRAVELQATYFKFSTERRCFEEETQSRICMPGHEGGEGRIFLAKCVRESHTGLVLPCVLVQSRRSAEDFVTSFFLYASSSNKIFLYGEFTSKYAILVGNIRLTDGPSACWRIDECKAFQIAKKDATSGRFEVSSVTDISIYASSSIMYCSMSPDSDLHIISVTQFKDCRTDEIQGWRWNNLRSNSKHPRRITTCKFVPVIYASIACCILVSIPEQENVASLDKQECFGERPPSPLSSTVSRLKNTTYVATSMKQLLKFRNGAFCKLASLPFDDAVDIVPMVTRGERMLVVRSREGAACIISCTTFQVIQEWKNVSCLYVDDILGNGQDQLLMLLNPSQDAARLRSFPEFILTDLDLCLVTSSDQLLHDGKDQRSDDGQSAPTPRSLVTAMQALEAKVENGLTSLREQELSRRLKDRIISQSMENLAQMAAGISNPMQRQPTLVHLCGTVPAHPSPPSTSGNDMAGRLKVTAGWQRIVNDKWVIGCKVTNENQWSVSDVKLLVLPWKTDSSQEPVGCEGYLQHPLPKGCTMESAAVTESQESYMQVPPSKRSKLQDIDDPASARDRATTSAVSAPSSSSSSSPKSKPAGRLSSPASPLEPGESCDAVATTTIPEFLEEPVASRLLVLQWTSQHPLSQGEQSGKNRGRVMSVICGNVHVGAADVLGCKQAVKLPEVGPMINMSFPIIIKLPRDPDGIEKQVLSRTDELAMDASQLTLSVRVTSRYTHLTCLDVVLLWEMSFQKTGDVACLCNCTSGVLRGSRVYWYNVRNNSAQLRVCTRGKREQMLFFHTLKSSLPVDVQFILDTPTEHMEEAIRHSVTSINNELQHMQAITDLACSTVATGMKQHERDGEGSEETPMEEGGGSDNNSNEQERLKRLREEFLKQQQTTKPKECSLVGDEAELLRLKLLELRENADNAITVLSRCI